MKRQKHDDGVFARDVLTPETYEERMAALLAMAEAQRSAPCNWLDDAQAEADRMTVYVREHNCPKADVWRVDELQRELANYHLAATPEYAAFRIGQILREAQIRLGSQYIEEARRIAEGRKNSAAVRAATEERDADIYEDFLSCCNDDPFEKSMIKHYRAVACMWYGEESKYKTIERAVKREIKRLDGLKK